MDRRSHHGITTYRRALVGGLAALVLLPGGSAAGVTSHDDSAAIVPGPSHVLMKAKGLGGAAYLEVTARTGGPYVEGTVLGGSSVCVFAATRSKGVTHEERGCLDRANGAYRFDGFGHAAANATIPTRRYTLTYERGPKGRRLVERRGVRSSATINLTWEGEGAPSLRPWVVAPYICYAMPPAGPVCWGGGVEFSRVARVDGTVELGGLDLTVNVRSEAGTMRWHAGR